MVKCEACAREFRSIQGLRGHQQMGCPGKASEPTRPEDRPVTQDDLRSLYQQLEHLKEENAGLRQKHGRTSVDESPDQNLAAPNKFEQEVARLAHQSGPPAQEPTAPGDYLCLDCPGANNLGGFFLSGAVGHYHATGHRLKHIPGSWEKALTQLHSFFKAS